MPNKVEEVISRVARGSLPRASDPYTTLDGSQPIALDANTGADGLDPLVIPDDSGKRYFAFGISRWKSSDADIIAE
jgi:hypothetical protein